MEAPFELTYDELLKMETRTATATLECAGNGRVFSTPKVKGAQWELGAVGNAEWTGVPLAALLSAPGVKPGAVEVILEGADEGEIDEPPRPGGKIHYSRSLPLAKARADVLLATRMNGEPLPPAHGFPLRAVVPGWYGMASVKWLRRIIVTDQAFPGYFQSHRLLVLGAPRKACPRWCRSRRCRSKPRSPGRPWARWCRRVPRCGCMARPGAAGRRRSRRWKSPPTGARPGRRRSSCGEPVKNAWRLWEWPWQTPAAAGRQTLMARATDTRGRTQPEAPRPPTAAATSSTTAAHRSRGALTS